MVIEFVPLDLYFYFYTSADHYYVCLPTSYLRWTVRIGDLKAKAARRGDWAANAASVGASHAETGAIAFFPLSNWTPRFLGRPELAYQGSLARCLA